MKCHGTVEIPFSIAGSNNTEKFYVVDELPHGIESIIGISYHERIWDTNPPSR